MSKPVKRRRKQAADYSRYPLVIRNFIRGKYDPPISWVEQWAEIPKGWVNEWLRHALEPSMYHLSKLGAVYGVTGEEMKKILRSAAYQHWRRTRHAAVESQLAALRSAASCR